jgi:broad specificity phosphatase PhoE
MNIDLKEVQKALEILNTPLTKKKRVMLIRHGQSEGNIRNLYYGSTDFPLTETGVFQAELLREVLKPYLPLFEGIKCSNLIRALETCKGCVNLQAKNMVSDFKNKTIKTTEKSWGVYPDQQEQKMQGEYTRSEHFKRIASNKNPSIEEVREMKTNGLHNYIEQPKTTPLPEIK